MNTSTKVIDLRTGKDNAVYTGYAEIPALTDAEVHCLVNADGWITLAYLLGGTNTEDLTADLIVFTTDANKEKKVDDETYFYLDVVSDGKLVENYELTEKQYNYIKDLGVGEYVYNEKGKLDSYTAFTEEWLDAKWSDGSIKIGDKTFKTISDDVVYKVLDITNGECYDLNRVTLGDLGLVEKDGKVNVKAYLHYDKYNKAVTELYVIVGKTATGAATVKGTNPDYVYAVDNANNKITKHADVEKVLNAADFLREAKLDGIVGNLNKMGDGKTAATAFELVATGCETKIDSAKKSTLDVTAMGTDMIIKAFYPKATATALATSTNGVLAFVDTYEQSAKNELVFSITNKDSKTAWFQISLELLAHTVSVAPKTGSTVTVGTSSEEGIDGTISVPSTLAGSANLTEAQLLAELTIGANKGVSYDATAKTLTIIAPCGEKVVYAVSFIEGASGN